MIVWYRRSLMNDKYLSMFYPNKIWNDLILYHVEADTWTSESWFIVPGTITEDD